MTLPNSNISCTITAPSQISGTLLSPITSGTIGSGNVTLNSPYNITSVNPNYTYLNSSNGHGILGSSSASTGFHVAGDSKFDGNVTIQGINLVELLTSIQDRLLILQPDTKKIEKHQALQKAYDHYKLMEKLIGDD